MAESLTHLVFGRLQWKEKFSYWSTQICQESGKRLNVMLVSGKDDPPNFLDRASQLFCRAMDAEPELLQEAIKKKLLALYQTWRQENQPELTAQELRHRLSLTLVCIDTVIPITLSYEIGDVFGGHSVEVHVDGQLQFKRVDLVG